MNRKVETKTESDVLKEALVTIRDLRTRLQEREKTGDEPIAIIGMACRFPGGCTTPEAFWQFLERGGDGVREIPPERWNADDFYDPNPGAEAKMYVKQAGFLNEDVGAFDARFFGISPREAIEMDPVHRLLLEVSWEVLERSGIGALQLRGSKTGVFVGIIGSEYGLIPRASKKSNPYTGTGIVTSTASGRISHILGFHGPTLSVDTACSSSLVSVHLACQSLNRGECDLALAGGAGLMLIPVVFIRLCDLRAVSPDGRCKSFASTGNGYGRGEGCGMAALKRLSDARRDGDPILAVIRASAVNHDGPSSGLTVPNGLSQQALYREALEKAKLTPADIDYLEAHGTGTNLGDPIEIQSIAEVFGKTRTKENPLVIGSVKANIGHAEAAAGIAGLIKSVLCLQHQTIPPQIHLDTLNPKIHPERIPAVIPTKAVPWKPNPRGKPRTLGLSSFGFSGTNAHLIISEKPFLSRERDKEELAPDRPMRILCLSAKNEDALKELVRLYSRWFADHPKENLADVCYTANTGRSHFLLRAAFIAEDTAGMQEKLETFLAGTHAKNKDNVFTGTAAEGVRPQPVTLFDRTLPGDLAQAAARAGDQWEILLQNLGRLYCAGADIDWRELDKNYQCRKLILPTYPFQRSRYWLDAIPFTGLQTGPAVKLFSTPGNENRGAHDRTADDSLPDDPLDGKLFLSPLQSHQLEYRLSLERIPGIKDNHSILHVGYYQEILYRAVRRVFAVDDYIVKEIEFLSPLAITGGASKKVLLVLDTNNPKDKEKKSRAITFQFHGWDEGFKTWTLYCRGHLRHRTGKTRQPSQSSPGAVDDIKTRCANHYTGEEFYRMMETRGLHLGPAVKWIDEAWSRDGEALARFRLPGETEDFSAYGLRVHPGVWDACAQLYIPGFSQHTEPDSKFIMVKWRDFTFNAARDARGRQELWCHVEIPGKPGPDGSVVGTFTLFDKNGLIIGQTRQGRLNELKAKTIAALQKTMDKTGTAAPGENKKSSPLLAALKGASTGKQKKILAGYLREKMAALLAMPVSDLEIDEPLRNLGMDSIAAVDFNNIITGDLPVELPLEHLLQGPSIHQLTSLLIQSLSLDSGGEEKAGKDEKESGKTNTKEYQTDPGSWIICTRPCPGAKIRLFCFPYGGGGASLYRHWSDLLPEEVEVCAIQPPGRENRLKETPITQIHPLVEILNECLQPRLDRPYAFYGHSMGALIAFRLAQRLNKTAKIKPRLLMVGAYSSPSIYPNPYLEELKLKSREMGFRDIPGPGDICRLKPDQLKPLLESTEFQRIDKQDKNMEKSLELFLPMLLADLKLVESCAPGKEEPPFAVPITAFHGQKDRRVSREDMEAWKQLTTGEFRLHELPGDHFFLHKDQDMENLLDLIYWELEVY